ncbi:site-specific DNA-methyltransferase [bacterium]|nr:site-specific DNA-methyltransferase [bacterium]
MVDKRRPRKLEYSDIDLSRWKEYEDILTDSWWDMKSRDRTNGHSFDYHGNFIPQIPNQVFRRYSREGDIVVDWFLGSGTSAIEAVNLNRRLIGIELKHELVEYVKGKLPAGAVGNSIRIIQGDSASNNAKKSVQNALQEMGADKAQLAVLHPPYADIIKFSELKADLSNCPSTDEFLAGFTKVVQNAYDTLENGRFAILVIGDKYSAGELDPLGFKCMLKMNEVGFRTKSIIVKNIEGNEKGKGKDTNLWRYRALSGGFYIFKHEYVMIFFK